MSNQLITNQEKLLSEVFNNILPSSQHLYFLVGYFYFSGFEEIYNNIEDKAIQILVGLEIEKDITNKIREYEIIDGINRSRGEVKKQYNESLIDLFNDTSFFDSDERQNAFRIFLSKIKDGSLEIRKTIQPNHSKMYLFVNKEEHSQGGEFKGTLITGSSNLSRAGLKGRHEINVVFRGEHFDEGLTLFKDFWESAVNIVNKDNYDDFVNEVVEKVWIDKLPIPYILYVRVLLEYFSIQKRAGLKLPSLLTKNKFSDLKYQIDAISQALTIIEKHNGVLVADVVGLGKSIIASTIAANLNMKTIVISPPHLVQQWDDYRFDFGFNARTYSSGKIEKALDENYNDEPNLIIIDEAHKYRNELNTDYALLHELCHQEGNKVVLLTATPFNNRPQDIFSMIKLFQIPTKSTIRTVDNLSYNFREMIKEYKKIKDAQKNKTKTDNQIRIDLEELANSIRDIISPLIIRRSRIDLKLIKEYKDDLKNQNISFPKVKDPELLEYDLGELTDLYINTLKRISPDDESTGFIGARYKPATYIKNIEKYKKKLEKEYDDLNLFKQGQRNLAAFMRHLLVRRFESSVKAFQKSLDSMIASSEYIKEWYDRLERIPIYKKGSLPSIEELLELTGEDAEIDLFEVNFEEQLGKYLDKGLLIIEKKELKKAFYDDLCSDIDLLKEIRDEWFKNGIQFDPKLDAFSKIVKKEIKNNRKRKIVVFTEFNDTANYVYEQLKDKLRVFKYSSADSNSTKKQIIKNNFDAGVDKKGQHDDYDILIATDAISEGYNLHRAGIIFNYDIPYNPTRVIQRVGRINRINKKVFDELFIYNFFPTDTGEQETRVKEITTLKLTMIHTLIGEDTKVLTNEEELRSYFVDSFKEKIKEDEAKASWDAKYYNELSILRATEPELIESAWKLPKRIRIQRKNINKNGVLVFGKKGSDYIFKLGTDESNVERLNTHDAIKLFECIISEQAAKTSKGFDRVYENVLKNLFIKKNQVAMDKGKREARDKIDLLLSISDKHKDYLKDLHTVITDLDALPDKYLRQIRKLPTRNFTMDLKLLMNDAPHKYLMNLIKKSESLDEGVESLILAEELL